MSTTRMSVVGVETGESLTAMTTTITCPTSEKLPDGTLAWILGCGSANVTGPDDDGLFDCLDCGIWFDPARESAS